MTVVLLDPRITMDQSETKKKIRQGRAGEAEGSLVLLIASERASYQAGWLVSFLSSRVGDGWLLLLGGLSNAKGGVCCALLADGARDETQQTAHAR